MKEKKQKKPQKKKRWLIILLILAAIPVLLISLAVGFLYNLPFFAEKFLNRKLTYSEANINVLKARVEYKDISFALPEGQELFTCSRLFFDIDVRKTLLFNPTVSSISIEKPRTFIIKDSKNSFKLPDFFEKKEGFSLPLKQILSFPFNIEQVNLSEGAISLQSVQGKDEILTDLKIFLPGFSTVKKDTGITPEISGRIDGKKFEFKGETEITKEYVKNSFNLSIKNLDINGIASLIPPVMGSVIKKGVATTDLNLVFATYNAKKPAFFISGTVYFNRLTLYNVPGGYYPLTNGAGKVEIAGYDVYNRKMNLKQLYLQKGLMTFQVTEAAPATAGGFSFFAQKFQAENIRLVYKNPRRKMDYQFARTNLTLTNVNNDRKPIDFIFKAFLKRSPLDVRGIYKKDDIVLEKIDIANLDPLNAGLHFKLPEYIQYLLISSIKGKGTYKDKKLIYSGQVGIEKVSIKKNDSRIEGGDISLNIHSYNADTRELSVESGDIKNLAFWYKNMFGLYNMQFLLTPGKNPYYFQFKKDFSFKEPVNLASFKGSCIYKTKEFDFSGEQLSLQSSFDFSEPTPVLTGGQLGLSDLVISRKENALFKVKQSVLNIKHISFNPLKIDFSTVTLDNFYAVIDRYKDNSIHYLGLIPAVSNGKEKEPFLNIDKLIAQPGLLTYRDYLIEDTTSSRGFFKTDIHRMKLEVTNFPSFVYPEGSFTCTGSFGEDDTVRLQGILGKKRMKGTLEIDDVYLIKFSPLFEQYLSHKVVNGRCDLTMKFDRNLDDAGLQFDVTFFNLDLHRVLGDKKQNLSIQVPLIEDEQGRLNLKNIDINWNMTNKKFQLAPVFFDIFIKMLSNIALPDFFDITGYKMDESYKMVSFIPGTDTARVDSKTGEELSLAAGEHNKTIVLETYVDKNIDQQQLKVKKLNEYMDYYSKTAASSEGPADILAVIYREVTGLETSLTSEDEIRRQILERMTISEEDYYSLAFSRLKSIKNILVTSYGIDEKKIRFREHNIYKNPYIKGISNNICIIRTGRK